MLGAMTPRAAALLAVAAAVGAGGCASEGLERSEREAPAPVRASLADWRWAPDARAPRPAAASRAPARERVARPEPEPRPARAPTPEPAPDVVEAEPVDLPSIEPGGAATDDAIVRAEVLDNGIALPPLEAPPEVRAIVEAGNVIARSPYKWGGGHGRWQDTGYDCSGSVSYALAAAGLLDAPLASGPLMSWGRAGKGKWVTIYSNPGHVFLVVAGVRFDTVANKATGSRWTNDMTDTSGYVARHPPGL
jgi:cell wall-associated NlpC family hydrolase